MKKNLLFLFVAIVAFAFTSCEEDKKDAVALQSISITPAKVVMNPGTSQRLNPVYTPDAWKGEVVWSSSDETLFTVDNSGNVTAANVESGAAVITVSAEGKEAKVNVSIADAYDTYELEIIPGLLQSYKEKINDSTILLRKAIQSQNVTLDATGATKGEGLAGIIDFTVYYYQHTDGKWYFSPWYYLGRDAEGNLNMEYTGLDYDAWTAAENGADPSPLFGKVRLGKIYPEKIIPNREKTMAGETLTDEEKKTYEGGFYYTMDADGVNSLGCLSACTFRYDTLEFDSEHLFFGEKKKNSITQFSVSFDVLPSLKSIHLKVGDVFPDPYFGDLAGTQVEEEMDYVAYPLTLEPARTVHYTGDFMDIAHPRTSAPRYIGKSTQYEGCNVQFINGIRSISMEDANIMNAHLMGVSKAL